MGYNISGFDLKSDITPAHGCHYTLAYLFCKLRTRCYLWAASAFHNCTGRVSVALETKKLLKITKRN